MCEVSIPLEQGNVFRPLAKEFYEEFKPSQSLWNRAMSFDTTMKLYLIIGDRLNPFGTGQCLSTVEQDQWVAENCVSIPLEQGNVFRQKFTCKNVRLSCLNPFGTGQCLSTKIFLRAWSLIHCLNPFGTGQCLSTKGKFGYWLVINQSQSLWNRAMSFDNQTNDKVISDIRLNPFGTGQCLSTQIRSKQ